MAKDLDRVKFPALHIKENGGEVRRPTRKHLMITVRKTVNTIFKRSIDKCIEKEYFKLSFENRSKSKESYRYSKEYHEIETALMPLLSIKHDERRGTEKTVNQNFQLFYSVQQKVTDEEGNILKDIKTGRDREIPDIKHIQPQGLLFFICLFLTDGEAKKLLNGETGFKRNDGLIWQSKRWAFTNFCCKPPAARLRSLAMTPDSLLLDMVGELQKCPNEIYPLLGVDDRERFRYGLDVYLNDAEEKIENETLHKRYDNRFPYLALRFLDTLNLPFYFQITLGKVNMKEYTKPFLGETIERKLQKEVKVFDRLSNYPYDNDVDTEGDIAIPAISKLIQDTRLHIKSVNNCILLDETKWTQFAPHYNLDTDGLNNTITLRLKFETFGSLSEKSITNKHGLPHLAQPDAILSLYDLPQLVWLAMQHKGPAKIEGLIKKEINKYKKAFNEEIENNGKNQPNLYKNHYPKPIYAILTSKQFKPIEKADKIISIILKDTTKRQDEADKWLALADSKAIRRKEGRQKRALNNQEAEYFQTIIPKGKRGAIATWLAKDLIWFCERNTRMQISSYLANAIQENLALFNKEQLQNALLYKGTEHSDSWAKSILEAHPFLKELNRETNLFQFYRKYITLRERDLNQQRTVARVRGLNKTILPELLGIDVNPKSLKSYLKPFKTTEPGSHLVINLPKGIFNSKIDEIINGNAPNSMKVDRTTIPFSFTYTLSQLHPDLQAFYQFTKNYKRFNEEKVEIESHHFTSVQNAKKTISSEMFKIINQTEKQIRHRQLEDRILLLMASKLSNKLFSKDIFETNSLSDFVNNNVWEKRQDFIFSVSGDSTPAKKANIWRIKANICLKDAGGFTKLLADKRLKQLLCYFDNADEIDYSYQLPSTKEAKLNRIKNGEFYFDSNYRPNIKDELEFYEEVREKMFEDCLAFEKYLCHLAETYMSDKFRQFYAENHYSNHLEDFLLPVKRLIAPENTNLKVNAIVKILNAMRNDISHNQFFNESLKTQFEQEILISEELRADFFEFGIAAIRNYYSNENKHHLNTNLSEDQKKERNRINTKRIEISIKYFRDTCEGRKIAFIAEWWMVVYQYLLTEMKRDLELKINHGLVL